jgi:hypothetical protein
MQSFALGVVTRLFFAIFEPTGNIRCQSSSSQISPAQHYVKPNGDGGYYLVHRPVVLLAPHLTRTPFA